jgi:hypothetical protein
LKDESTRAEPLLDLEWPDRAGCDFIGPCLDKHCASSLLCPPGPVRSSLVFSEGDNIKMSIITTVAQPRIIGGVDAHKDTHHVVALDGHGIRLADQAFPATLVGYQQLLNWLRSVGLIDRVGVESSGSYGAGLARFLKVPTGSGPRGQYAPCPHASQERQG